MGAVVELDAVPRRKRFGDFAHEQPTLEGTKCKIDDIINQEVEVLGFRILESNYPKENSQQYLTLQVRSNGKTMVVFTGSNVLTRQAEQYAKEIPFFATIRKIGRYYTFA
jgi:hypothetical protein